MSYRPMRRLWLRGPRPRRSPSRSPKAGRKGRGGHLLLSLVLGVGLALLVICWVDAGVRPVVEEMAQVKVKNTITAIVNDAAAATLAAEAVAYDDIVAIQKDDSGRITAMTTSSSKMLALRTEILGAIVEQVDSLDTEELGIPLGNLTGFASASDRGPLLPVRVVSVASADATFQNQFTAAGINQTLHQVMLDITVTVQVLIPGGSLQSVVSAQVPVAETIIVGQVPEAYLQFGGNGGGSLGTNTALPAADGSSGGAGGGGFSSSAPFAPSGAQLRPAI